MEDFSSIIEEPCNDWYEDIADDRDTEISGKILNRIATKEWCISRFGNNYTSTFISKESLSFYIDLEFEEPAVDLGLEFDHFTIPSDARSADSNNELLSEIDAIVERFEFFTEVSEIDDVWRNLIVDEYAIAKFLPLMMTPWGSLMFHGPHLYILLSFICATSDFAPFLTRASGPHGALFIPPVAC